jgi:hypothetical protein
LESRPHREDKLAVLLPQQELTISTSSGLHLATSKIDWASALKIFPVDSIRVRAWEYL